MWIVWLRGWSRGMNLINFPILYLMEMRAGVTCEISNYINETKKGFLTPIEEASSDATSFQCKFLNNQTSHRKDPQYNWN